MAKVPTYEGGGVVDPISIPRQQGLPAGAFGIGQPNLADSASKILDAAAGFFGEQEKIRDADMVNRAEVGFATAEQDFRAKMAERLGVNAHGATKDTEKWVQEQYRSTMDTLENDRQRKAFEARFAQRALSLRGDAIAHEAKQAKESYAESKSALIGQAIADGIGDIKKMPESRERIISSIDDVAKLRGWTPEVAALEAQKHLSSLHTGIIKSMQDPAMALNYFNEHQGEIEADKRAPLYEQLKGVERDSRLQGDIDGMMKQGLTESQALAWAREKYAGKDEDDAVVRVKQRYQEETERIKANEEELLKPINTQIGDALQAGRIIKKSEQDAMLKEIRLTSPDLYLKAQQLIHSQNKQLEAEFKAEKAAREDALSKGDKLLNWISLKNDIIKNPESWTRPGRDLIKELTPYVKSGQITASNMDDAIDMVTKIKSNKAAYASLASADDHLQDLLMKTTVDGVAFSKLKANEQRAITARARQQIDPILQQLHIDKADTEKIKTVIDSTFVTPKFRSTFLGVTYGKEYDKPGAQERVFDTNGAMGRITASFVSQIPAATRTQIESAIRAAGDPVTNEAILAYYNEGIK